MYQGWLTFAGTEIVNARRTVAYAEALLPTLWLKDRYECDNIQHTTLEFGPYVSPAADDAPWYDADTPGTAGFLGLYPLSMDGFTDSTREVEFTESINDGGSGSPPRHASREMRVTGLLIGVNQNAAEAGLTWLKSILSGSNCLGGCGGDDLCFAIACPPTIAEATSVVRHMREVTCVDGPRIMSEYEMVGCGGWAIQVEFWLTAGTPFLYGEPVLVASAESLTTTAHLPGATIALLTENLPICSGSPHPVTPPIVDPDCPPLPLPPTVPAVIQSCDTTPPTNYRTYAIYVPDGHVKEWQDGIMQLQIETGSTAVRKARIRLLPRPLASQDVVDLDPCAACGDFMVNYIPAGAVMTLDGMTERISVAVGNKLPTTGSHLVSGVYDEVFEWPLFTCGLGYYVLVEVDQNVTLKALALNIANRE